MNLYGRPLKDSVLVLAFIWLLMEVCWKIGWLLSRIIDIIFS